MHKLPRWNFADPPEAPRLRTGIAFKLLVVMVFIATFTAAWWLA